MRASLISGKTGVTIGEKATVGACALVNKNVAPNTVVVGVPCKPIRAENSMGGVRLIERFGFYNYAFV